MGKKANWGQLEQDLNPSTQELATNQKSTQVKITNLDIGTNTPRGERGGFQKLVVTMPPEMAAAIRSVSIHRKAQGLKDSDSSALVREAITAWLITQEVVRSN